MAESRKRTKIIAHRGASSYIPEHSLAAYSVAFNLGADYIEPDLVLSKDGIFFALHDLLLDGVSDISQHPEFSDRLTTKIVGGKSYTGYFVSDFLSTELKTLHLRQRLPSTRSTLFDGLLKIPTLTEIVTAHKEFQSRSDRIIGMYIELKHPIYYKSLGFSMEDMILKFLTDEGYPVSGISSDLSKSVAPVVIQCFTPETLISLRSKCDLPLVQLLGLSGTQTVDDVWNARNLDVIMGYANGVGPPTAFFSNDVIDFKTASYMALQATERNLVLHPYVIKSDEEMRGNSTRENLFFICCLGVDGIFTDYTDRTRVAVELTYHDPSICKTICPEKFTSDPLTTYISLLVTFLIIFIAIVK
jgi:glycerophosphoryl diester phosphodiesterase